jgi:hypothetical protein
LVESALMACVALPVAAPAPSDTTTDAARTAERTILVFPPRVWPRLSVGPDTRQIEDDVL